MLQMKNTNSTIKTVIMALSLYSQGAFAKCTLNSNSTQTQTVNVGANLASALNIPRDTPNGTVIYEETGATNQKFAFVCDSQASIGIKLNPSLGVVPEGSTIFPLGNTGLSFRLRDAARGYYPSVHPIPSGSWYLLGEPVRFEIIKTGKLSPQPIVLAGYLGQQIADELVAMNLYLTKPIIVNASACQTPAVSVQMGDDYLLDEFGNAGDTSRLIKFNIALNECQSGIKKVTYSLKATSQIIDQQQGVVALNSDSTAKGIGLKLMNESGQPLALGTTYPFTSFNSTSTDFKIPLSAAYYRLPDSKLKAGTANASVTFVVNYL
ncbi:MULTISPECIES: fimbrial protein [unclassified Pseudomonas]|uniref:fimbrial protein n=1 Tax=unclassified Pseudomonas TaxID=196821 RepID=UPI0030DD7C0F